MGKRKKTQEPKTDWQSVDDDPNLLYAEVDGRPAFLINSARGLQAAVALLAEKQDQRREVEQIMDEEYGVVSLDEETAALQSEVTRFMSANDIRLAPLEGRGRWQLVRPSSGSWDQDKLKGTLGDKRWKQVTRRVLDPNLLDQAFKAGKIEQEEIADAYVQKESKPYTRFYPEGKRVDHENEADALAEALGD